MPTAIDPVVVKLRVGDETLARVQDNLANSIQQILDCLNAEPFTPPKNIAQYDQQGRVVKKAKAGAIGAVGATFSANVTLYGKQTIWGSKSDSVGLAIIPAIAGVALYVANVGNTVPTFTVYDTGGTIQSGVSTAAGFVTTATGFRRAYQMGTFWSNGTMPTANTSMVRPICFTASNGAITPQTMVACETMAFAGSVISITGWANGAPGGTWTLTLFKNGAATTLAASSAGQPLYATFAKGSLTFVPGDVLGLTIKGSSASMNQSFSASIEVESAA